MDEKLLAVVAEALSVSKQISLLSKDIADSKDKQNELNCRTQIKIVAMLATVILITSILFTACCFYFTWQSYNYEGYPETQIDNTQIGGDYIGEETKATKTP